MAATGSAQVTGELSAVEDARQTVGSQPELFLMLRQSVGEACNIMRPGGSRDYSIERERPYFVGTACPTFPIADRPASEIAGT